ncbi:MAG: hypothetical protein C5B56_06475 [Proteobacteria bacterium]|nr:MAG: hypothetical protein C5B56_06475 [Pseudomonadota bacterium]
MSEVESLDWRVSRLEVAFVSLVRVWTWAYRLYRRVGHALLRTPLAGVCHRLMGHLAADERYRQWFIQHRATDPYRTVDGGRALAAVEAPLISLIMPLHQPNPAWLKAAVDSVRAQLHGGWELVIVTNGDPVSEVGAYLRSAEAEDPRIRCFHHAHAGASATLNRGLEACVGTYAAFIDQHDVLEPTALSHIAAAILYEDPDILYTDEDFVDQAGNPQLPLFKPAWSPALLLSCMYVGHLLVVTTERAREIGGFREAFDGAQDYDFLLRLTDRGAKVVHIPRVLYHWRQRNESTTSREEKPGSHAAGLKAVQDALTRRQYDAIAKDGPSRNTYNFTRSVTSGESATIIVPTRNSALLSSLLESLHSEAHGKAPDVLVIQHCQGSAEDDKIAAVAARFGARAFEYRGPFNFALMNNLAIAGISSDFLILMNDDVVVRGGNWLEELCAPFVRLEVGITGALLHYPDGMIEHSGVVTGIGDGVGHAGRFQVESPFWPWLKTTRNVSAVTGACLAIRRTVFEQLGGFDIRFFNNYNDVDLCLRAQNAGFEVVLSTTADVMHVGGKTRMSGTALHERLDFWARWGKLLSQVDYFYSPNLSRRLEAIDLSVPSWR